jgi:hypothetical protein
MSNTNRNFIIAYILLVGLPILGLVGILKRGHKITAPVSVDGVWKLHADAAHLAALPCGKSLAAAPDIAMAISQSGGNFTWSLVDGPKSAGSGVLEGATLKAAVVPSAPWSSEADCGRGHEFTLLATVDPKTTPRSLTGTLSLNDCPSCGTVEFRGFQQAPAGKGGH